MAYIFQWRNSIYHLYIVVSFAQSVNGSFFNIILFLFSIILISIRDFLSSHITSDFVNYSISEKYDSKSSLHLSNSFLLSYYSNRFLSSINPPPTPYSLTASHSLSMISLISLGLPSSFIFFKELQAHIPIQKQRCTLFCIFLLCNPLNNFLGVIISFPPNQSHQKYQTVDCQSVSASAPICSKF